MCPFRDSIGDRAWRQVGPEYLGSAEITRRARFEDRFPVLSQLGAGIDFFPLQPPERRTRPAAGS